MKLLTFGKKLESVGPAPLNGPDWVQANPRWIKSALKNTQQRPTGGWYVLGSARELNDRPRRYQVAGHQLVAFRSGTSIVVGGNACPHMGASLAEGRIEGGQVVCPWHGLRLGCQRRGSWQPLPAHDDGVLLWVRLAEAEQNPTAMPFIAARPKVAIFAVVSAEAHCDPIDIIANRLDPWHGAHFHPYAFARLSVLEIGDDEITVRVAKRLAGPVCIEVDARFHSPEPRTIVMTIIAGEGVGSVVETHATPISEGRTLVIEANMATSDRKSFLFARRLSTLIRPLMARSARRLWIDDIAYAERLFQERHRLQTNDQQTNDHQLNDRPASPTLESGHDLSG